MWNVAYDLGRIAWDVFGMVVNLYWVALCIAAIRSQTDAVTLLRAVWNGNIK